jgi:hypothetical protein
MTRRKGKEMTQRTLMKTRNSLWDLHPRGKVVEEKEGSPLRVRVCLITHPNNQRKSISKEVKTKLMNLPRRVLDRYC